MTLGQYPNADDERRRVDDPSLATELDSERLADMAPPAHLEPECKLLRFNPIRARRGVGAAEVSIGGAILWMTRHEVRNNISLFGKLKGLTDALAHYLTGEKYPPDQEPTE